MPSPAPRTLGRPELAALATGLAARPELWRAHVALAPGEARALHPLVREDQRDRVAPLLGSGADTGFHDHDGAAGAVAVVAGAVCEERLRIGGAPAARIARPGDRLEFGPDDIHRVTWSAGAPAVTAHAYSPGLRRTGAYTVSPDGVLQRQALHEDTELASEMTMEAAAR